MRYAIGKLLRLRLWLHTPMSSASLTPFSNDQFENTNT